MTKKTIIKITTLLIIGFLLPKSALGVGQMTKPIIIKNALKGQTIESTLVLYNSNDKEAIYGLAASGDIKDWTSFYLIDNSNKTITEIKIPAKSKIDAIAKFLVPSDAPNGVYTGEVAILEIPGKNGAGKINVSVGSRIGREVSITVTDKETINFTASVIPKNYDLAKNEPLSFRVIYTNSGNVSITPEINLKIKKDNKTITSIIYPYPDSETPVKSLGTKEIPAIEIPATNFEKGEYSTELSFTENGNEIYKYRFRFSVDITELAGSKNLLAGIDGFAMPNGQYSLIAIVALSGLMIGIIVAAYRKILLRKKSGGDEIDT